MGKQRSGGKAYLQAAIWNSHHADVGLNGTERKIGSLSFAVLTNGIEQRRLHSGSIGQGSKAQQSPLRWHACRHFITHLADIWQANYATLQRKGYGGLQPVDAKSLSACCPGTRTALHL